MHQWETLIQYLHLYVYTIMYIQYKDRAWTGNTQGLLLSPVVQAHFLSQADEQHQFFLRGLFPKRIPRPGGPLSRTAGSGVPQFHTTQLKSEEKCKSRGPSSRKSPWSWVWAEHPLTHGAGRTVTAKGWPHCQRPLVPAPCPQPGARGHLRFGLSNQPVPLLWLLLMYSKLGALVEFVIPSALGSGNFLLRRVAARVPANKYSCLYEKTKKYCCNQQVM